MKSAILSMFVATKLVVLVMTATVDLQDETPRLAPALVSLVSMADPLTGGYRRKDDEEVART